MMRRHLKFYHKKYTIDITNDMTNQNNLRFQTNEINKYDKINMIIGILIIMLILSIICYKFYSKYNNKKILPKDKKDIENGLINQEDDIIQNNIHNSINKMGLFDHIIINIIPNGIGIFKRRRNEVNLVKNHKIKRETKEDIDYLKKIV